MSDRLDNKIALVTGGASGIGLACVKVLADAGATVIVTDIDADQAQRVCDDIQAAGGKAAYHSLDVTSEAQWRTVIDEVVASHGGLDVLVNNAGIFLTIPLLETTLESWKRVHEINLDGTFLGLREAVRVMLPGGSAGRGGSIVNISSCAGLRGSAGHSAYCSSKAGVHLLTQAAAVECAANGIRVNSVHPALVETPMLDAAKERWADALTDGDMDAMNAEMTNWHPMGRAATAEEVAKAVLYFASDASSFCTGGEIKVDGGYCARGQ